MVKNTGTLIIATIRPYDSDDTYPAAIAGEIKGGYHQVADDTARDAIPSSYRTVGMMAYVISTAKLYWLVGGVENTDWEEVTLGSSSNSYFPSGW